MSKLALRRTWFQVHKWIGLILAVLIIPLSVTGAALVWDQQLDHVLNPQRYAVSGGTAVDPARYLEVARTALKPGERIVSLSRDIPGPVVVAAAQPPGKVARPGPPARTFLWIDPPTARILDQGRGGGLVRTMHNIHGNLMVPAVGRAIVGWIGVAMAISCFTGLWLWWPTVGRWTRGLRWRRHPQTDTNLHHMTGFWIALPLFILSVTGVWIAAPQMIGGGQRGPGGPGGPGGGGDRARPQPLEAPRLPVGSVIASAQAIHPGDWRQLDWPTDRKPAWTVRFIGSQDSVSIDDARGTATLDKTSPETTARLMRRIHDGSDMGIVWQIIIFIGGIVPGILAITGIIMWWRARGWKAELKAKQAARA